MKEEPKCDVCKFLSCKCNQLIPYSEYLMMMQSIKEQNEKERSEEKKMMEENYKKKLDEKDFIIEKYKLELNPQTPKDGFELSKEQKEIQDLILERTNVAVIGFLSFYLICSLFYLINFFQKIKQRQDQGKLQHHVK